MNTPTTLRELFEFCCQQFPDRYVSLDCRLNRHPPFFGHLQTAEGTFSLHIASVEDFEAPTIALLIDRTLLGLRSVMDQRKAQAEEVYAAIQSVWPTP